MAEVTTCADPAELAAALGPIFGYFGRSPDEGVGERFARVLPPERMHVAREDGLVVAGGGAFPFELTVPGGRSVRARRDHHRRPADAPPPRPAPRADARPARRRPRARRAGLVPLGLRRQIYGRFGYGMASMTAEIDLQREHARLARRRARRPAAALGPRRRSS